MNYYVEAIMNFGKVEITYASALLFGMSALFFYPVNRISKRFGYRLPMLAALLMLMVFSVLLFFLGKFIPIKMGFVIFGLIGIPVAGAAFIFPPAMLSEIAAVASQKTGVQIEGLFFGLQGFVLKFSFFLSGGLLPIILVSRRFKVVCGESYSKTRRSKCRRSVYDLVACGRGIFDFVYILFLLSGRNRQRRMIDKISNIGSTALLWNRIEVFCR